MTDSSPPPTTHSKSLILTTAHKMYKEGGIRTFYRGCMPALVGIVPYAGVDLMVFETLKVGYSNWINKDETRSKKTPSVFAILCFGMLSGTFSASLMYPIALIRTR